ncbi:hypothetical protein DL93DRAFT_483215 [Clavulina sp. PMI_390]|nr:hypothetical protein DL93DRAFT_483215 [Clavulina sp. PMI_390]
MRNIAISEHASYVLLTFVAAGLIYVGAHESLEYDTLQKHGESRQNTARPDARQRQLELAAPINSSEAWQLPLIGSVVLLGLWLMLKYLNADLIRFIFALYFALAGTAAVWNALHALSRAMLSDAFWARFKQYSVSIPLWSSGNIPVQFTIPGLLIAIVSVIPSALYIWERGPRGFEATFSHAILNDIIAGSLAFGVLKVFQLDGFMTGCILLSGLFIYDAWWVFGTPVMVDVAQQLDAPVLLLWPRSLNPWAPLRFSMLGLGDIVLPGAFITTCLRFDQASSVEPSETTNLLLSPSFKKPYFNTTLVAYIIGLNITSLVVQLTEHPQPALLYLSPACIGAFYLTARRREEVSKAWKWKFEPKTDPLPVTRADAATDLPGNETESSTSSSVDIRDADAKRRSHPSSST